MVRSPIFILLIVLCLFSCKDEPVAVITPAKVSKEANTEAVALRNKAISFFTAKRFDSAYYYFNKSKEIFAKEKDSANIAYNLIQMAGILQTFGDYNESEVTLTEAENYVGKEENYKEAIYNYYGIALKEAGNYDDAIEKYNILLKETANATAKQSVLNNIATVYIEKKEYGTAIGLLDGIIKSKLFDVDSLQDKKARVIDNLGYALYKSGQNDKGLMLMIQGLEMRNTINDSYGSIESYLHLSDYFKNKNPNKSNEYAKMAYKIATEHKSIDERLEALSFLMTSKSKEKSNEYSAEFIKLNDSIKKVRNNNKNQFAKIRYDSEKATLKLQKLRIEKTEDQLKLEKANSETTIARLGILLLASIFIVAVLLFIVILKHYRAKTKIEKQKAINAVYDTETRISKKLHDELANEVFQVMSFAETQDLENPNKKEVLLDNLDKIYSNTRNISRENSTIDTGENFGFHLKHMLANYESDNLKVIINSNGVDWEKVKSVNKIAIFRVLQELMVNMKKHSKCSIAIISFETKKDTLEIRYSDNGVGIGDKLNYKNGLHNAENRINAINGTITFDEETEKGFKAKISIPN